MMPETRLCLVRHGETHWNADRRIQGQIDSGLNETGTRQAAAAAAALASIAFDAVYSSDLRRARDTAEAIAAAQPRVTVRLDPGLRERHYGIFQGLTYEEARTRYPHAYGHFHVRDTGYDFENGESLLGFAKRVTDCLTAIAGEWVGRQVLIVAHGGVLDIAHRLATGKPLTQPRDFTISNAAISWIARSGGAWRLVSWNVPPGQQAGLDELPG
jgi:probable phosphoglycerate mutase